MFRVRVIDRSNTEDQCAVASQGNISLFKTAAVLISGFYGVKHITEGLMPSPGLGCSVVSLMIYFDPNKNYQESVN